MLIALSANMHFAIVDSGDDMARIYANANPYLFSPGFVQAQISLTQTGAGLYYTLFYMCFLLFLAVVGFPFLTTLCLSIAGVAAFSTSYFMSVTLIDNDFGNTTTPSLTALIPLLASTVGVILLKYQTERAMRLSHLATLNAEAIQKQREAELWLAQQDLVSWVCHEIRNPLNGVIGFAEMIQASSTMEAPRCAQHILQCASYMSQLVDNIRDLTKLEQGTLVLKPETFVAATLLQEVEQLVRHRKRSGVKLIFRCPSSLELHGDVLRWKQLLINLVANALELTHHGFVRVEVKRIDTTGVSVKVGDTGPGLSEVNRNKIFNRVSCSAGQSQSIYIKHLLIRLLSRPLKCQYVQVGGQRSNNRGSGLGLAIAKGIAELMHTNIQVFSPNPELSSDESNAPVDAPAHASSQGKGALFSMDVAGVCIPRPTTVGHGTDEENEWFAADRDESELTPNSGFRRVLDKSKLRGKPSEGASDGGSQAFKERQLGRERNSAAKEARIDNGSKVSILIIEDELLNAMILKTKVSEALGSTSFSPAMQVVTSGEEALSVWRGRPDSFDCAIVDEHLAGELKGSQVVQQIREGGFKGGIIFASGNCLPENNAQYIRCGANRAWPKPYPHTSLMRKDLVALLPAVALSADARPLGDRPDARGGIS
jgi:signal transduction histidine kinase